MRTSDLPELLFGAYRHRVLSLLLLRPQQSYHVREIARLTGVPAGSLHRELRLLAAAGVLRGERAGNQLRYRADRSLPVFGELARIVQKTSRSQPLAPARGLAAVCRRYGVRRLSLFGSAARGELGPRSDIDLMVEFTPDSATSLFDLVPMQDELSRLFGGRKVDLASPEILANPYRRRSIERDLRVLYEA